MRSMELVGRERMQVAVSPRRDHDSHALTLLRNNSRNGEKAVMTTSLMSRTNSGSSSMRLANSKINSLTDTINIGSRSSLSATSRPQSNPVETVQLPNSTCGPMLMYSGKQHITDQIAQLKYKQPNSPKIVVLEQELVRAEAESLVAEAQLSNITREKLKAAFTYQFDALREHCEKLAIIAGYGKHLLELVDDTPVTPGETRNAYDGYEASKASVSARASRLLLTISSIIQDCEDALTNWITANAAVRSKLSTRARTLSQRRKRAQGEGVDLSSQDQSMKDRDSWVPASAHQGGEEYEDEEEEEEEEEEPHGSVKESTNSEKRGREAVAA
jgi:hypothetical protein